MNDNVRRMGVKILSLNDLWVDLMPKEGEATAVQKQEVSPSLLKTKVTISEKHRLKKHIVLKTAKYQIKLTARESETLLLISYGNTVPESARMMGLSSRTVELYVVKLRHKFHCQSKRQLIEQVIADGLLLQLRQKVDNQLASIRSEVESSNHL